jgi:hypothetical protein
MYGYHRGKNCSENAPAAPPGSLFFVVRFEISICDVVFELLRVLYCHYDFFFEKF